MKELDQFTVEQLSNFIESDHAQCGDVAALARIALSAKQAEPVYQERRYQFSGKKQIEYWADINNSTYGYLPKSERRLIYTTPPSGPLEIPDGWINCNDNLPLEDDLCLAIDDQGVIWTMIFEDDDFGPDTGGVCPNEITHWMPLPAAPTSLLEGESNG
ncbi:hypothetical protein PL78_00080 [Yersinia entomophaga]|uniref:DUF551 domain-containing protein n=1 Tax=Yersinia entomophaga TaxID=935293 RepID=A0ABM6BG06_YERET|nr:DUF551 domain-containing protein [Yersinia entomophaga]ANI28239.1 hypothetical protein PL78_00080 [Yersinia entomophaga]OWF84431.1 hypothetical protein B4914_19155 [Yersinia entomophaga]